MTSQEALTKIGNCQTQVGLPIFKFKRKEIKIVQDDLIKKSELEETIQECIKLLEKEGINSKQIVKEILKKVIE